jgi:putative cell wall-binding protein
LLVFAGTSAATARVGDPFLVPYPHGGMGESRLAGATRYETAVEISEKCYPEGSEAVVIATGVNFPDALSGAAIASALRAPLLLTKPGELPAGVVNEIERLDPEKAVILGSADVVSPGIETWLRARMSTVERYGGEDRYETAALVARELEQEYTEIPGRTAIVTIGTNFPDALAGSPLSAIMGWPVLLVKRDSIPAATASALADLDIRRSIVLGDETAVSGAVAARLPDVTRLGGDTRYDTMAAISRYMRGLGLPDDYVSVATGLNFPDALAGGVLTARYGGVLLLSTPDVICPQAEEELGYYAGDINILFEAYGGKDVISDAVLNTVWSWGP